MPSKRKHQKLQNNNDDVTTTKKPNKTESGHQNTIMSPLSYDRDLTQKISQAFR